MQVDCRPKLYVPSAQALMVATVVEGQAWPAGQSRHRPSPVREKVPAGQAASCPTAEHWNPASQVVHEVADPVEYVPGGHATSRAVVVEGQ